MSVQVWFFTESGTAAQSVPPEETGRFSSGEQVALIGRQRDGAIWPYARLSLPTMGFASGAPQPPDALLDHLLHQHAGRDRWRVAGGLRGPPASHNTVCLLVAALAPPPAPALTCLPCSLLPSPPPAVQTKLTWWWLRLPMARASSGSSCGPATTPARCAGRALAPPLFLDPSLSRLVTLAVAPNYPLNRVTQPTHC